MRATIWYGTRVAGVITLCALSAGGCLSVGDLTMVANDAGDAAVAESDGGDTAAADGGLPPGNDAQQWSDPIAALVGDAGVRRPRDRARCGSHLDCSTSAAAGVCAPDGYCVPLCEPFGACIEAVTTGRIAHVASDHSAVYWMFQPLYRPEFELWRRTHDGRETLIAVA